MAAEILNISDAVVVAVNAASMSLPFTALRDFVPRIEVKDLQGVGGVWVRVVPRTVAARRVDRSRTEYTYRVDIGVQAATTNQINDTTTFTIDQIILLGQEIAQLLRDNRLVDYSAAVCTETQVDPVYSPEHFSEMGVVTTIIVATFIVVR